MSQNNGKLDKILNGLLPRQRIEALARLGQAMKEGGAKQLPLEDARRIVETVTKTSPKPSPSETATDGETGGRDKASGRFTPGNRFSKGNPFSRRQCEMRAALAEAVGAEGVKRLGRKLLAKALCGSVEAAELLFAYLLGKPTPAMSVDRLDLEDSFQEMEKRFANDPDALKKILDLRRRVALQSEGLQ